MDQFEKLERLKEKTGVSYEDAREALEANEWDLLDAVVYLEKHGKVNEQKSAHYSTNEEKVAENGDSDTAGSESRTFTEIIGCFLRWCGKILKKGNQNSFCIERSHAGTIRVPITVFVLFLFFAFWITLPLLVVGLFFGIRYSFMGPDIGNEKVNDLMDKASETADMIKEDFKSGYNKSK